MTEPCARKPRDAVTPRATCEPRPDLLPELIADARSRWARMTIAEQIEELTAALPWIPREKIERFVREPVATEN